MENTRDLRDFGLKELRLVARLLFLLKTPKDITVRLGDHVTPEYNPDSGLVFLVCESFCVAMINDDGLLEDWLVCPNENCAKEGFAKDLQANCSPCCNRYLKECFG